MSSPRTADAACPRRRTSSFSRMLWTWFLTVETRMPSRRAISLFDRDSSRSRATSRSRGQFVHIGRRRALLGERDDPVEQERRNPRRAQTAAVSHDRQGGAEIIERDVVRYEAHGAGFGPRHHVVGGFMDRQRHDPERRSGLEEQRDRARTFRDGVIDEEHLSSVHGRPDQVDRCRQVRGRSNHTEPAIGLEGASEALPIEACPSNDRDRHDCRVAPPLTRRESGVRPIRGFHRRSLPHLRAHPGCASSARRRELPTVASPTVHRPPNPETSSDVRCDIALPTRLEGARIARSPGRPHRGTAPTPWCSSAAHLPELCLPPRHRFTSRCHRMRPSHPSPWRTPRPDTSERMCHGTSPSARTRGGAVGAGDRFLMHLPTLVWRRRTGAASRPPQSWRLRVDSHRRTRGGLPRRSRGRGT